MTREAAVSRRFRRSALALTTATVGALALGSQAIAAITPTVVATEISAAVTTDPAFVTAANFDAIPPGDPPPTVANAVSDTPLAGFPRHGTTYGILSTGDAQLADDANTDPGSGEDAGGGNVRGDTDFDVTVLRIDLNVPATANCLTLDFRFLSEEYPEFVGTQFNDAFIAELDSSTWTTSGSTISAPNNFAFDQAGNVISINSTGAAQMSEAEAAGTTYDGATPLLQTRTPITPGPHSLFLSIFDQGDNVLDSAVFIDALDLINVPAAACQRGVGVPVTTPPSAGPAAPPTRSGTCRGQRATIVGTPGPETLRGTSRDDVIQALGGNDVIKGVAGDDLVCGHRGRDRIRGGADDDRLIGGAGRDSVSGGAGDDRIFGGTPGAPPQDARDLCIGGAGDDRKKNCELGSG